MAGLARRLRHQMTRTPRANALRRPVLERRHLRAAIKVLFQAAEDALQQVAQVKWRVRIRVRKLDHRERRHGVTGLPDAIGYKFCKRRLLNEPLEEVHGLEARDRAIRDNLELIGRHPTEHVSSTVARQPRSPEPGSTSASCRFWAVRHSVQEKVFPSLLR